MKKAAFAALLSAAVLSLCATVALAQDSSQVTIKDQAEYNAFTNAESQTTPAAKAAAIEGWGTRWPDAELYGPAAVEEPRGPQNEKGPRGVGAGAF